MLRAKAPLRLTPLTLLTGVNGTGKSSVIQSLLLLRQSYDHGLLRSSGLPLEGDSARCAGGGIRYSKESVGSFANPVEYKNDIRHRFPCEYTWAETGPARVSCVTDSCIHVHNAFQNRSLHPMFPSEAAYAS